MIVRKNVTSSFIAVMLTLVAMIAGSGRAHAQGIGVAVTGGPNWPQFSLDPDTFNIDNRPGWQVGVALGGNRTGVFGIQTEVNYQRLRAAVNQLTGDRGHADIDYIQIPVLARLNLGTHSKNIFAIYAIVGPSFDIKVNETFSDINPPPPDDSFETLDIGLLFGAGVEITRLIIEGRYEIGLKQLNKNFQETSELKVNTFTLLFGLRFF